MNPPDIDTMGPGPEPGFRIEHDTMGEVRVPADALWAAQTQRAVENFAISGTPIDEALVRALGQVKAAAAATNGGLRVLDPDLAAAIGDAAREVASGRHTGEFPVDVFQTGSGTSSNMNANEVIATLAGRALGRPVHPNDHVNASQSSNDVFPTAIHVAAMDGVVTRLIPALMHLATTLRDKATELDHVVKAGRTHLMDATPVTLGQELRGYAAQVTAGVERLTATLPRLGELALGGTAVGTGINAPPEFAGLTVARLATDTGLPFAEARDHFEAQGARDALVELSGALRTVAVSLVKICNDLRWMASGPRTGLGEIGLPDLQPGSSIMPGKVNPVIAEATLMVCAQVIGYDATVTFAGASGSFELNVMMPVMARSVLESIRLLTSSVAALADRCIHGIEAKAEHCRDLAESSPAIVTPLARVVGYERAAVIAKRSVREGTTIRAAALDEGVVADGSLSAGDLDRILDIGAMTRPRPG